jgi:amino acid permease
MNNSTTTPKNDKHERLLEKSVLFLPVLVGLFVFAIGVDMSIEVPVLKDFGQAIMGFGIFFAVYFFWNEKEHQQLVRKLENDLKEMETFATMASMDPDQNKKAQKWIKSFNERKTP